MSSIRFYFLNKCFQELPKFLKDRNYQSPNNALDTTFQQAFDTKQHAFSWVQTQPNILGNFLASMPVQQGTNSWTSAIPLVKRLESADPSAVQFVDIGGGLGSQCVAFINATKGSLPGKVILQDLPETLGLAHNHEGMEKMAQNYFEGQDIKGGSVRILGIELRTNCLQNHRCHVLLSSQCPARISQRKMPANSQSPDQCHGKAIDNAYRRARAAERVTEGGSNEHHHDGYFGVF